MEPNKSLDEYELITTLLHDVFETHGVVFNNKSRRCTLLKVLKRLDAEGIGFLTKTMPRLGKAFDRALADSSPLNGNLVGFENQPGSKLPRFLGELFNRVLSPNGTLLQHPCAASVASLRQVLYLFYKYELPYDERQEHEVISKFEKTENDLHDLSSQLSETSARLGGITPHDRRNPSMDSLDTLAVTREARILLASLLASFDPYDIYPRHGPGVVATRQRLWNKFRWTNVCSRITDVYPFDAYFCASGGHVCDSYHEFKLIGNAESSARVLLVPKDSRGPRLISCEPVDFQWIQQGLGRAIVKHVEEHYLTKDNVRFTSQRQNQIGALYGSSSGKYSTLDLAEASDRIHVDLVRLLFPEHVLTCLEACRSLSTVLPSGKTLVLKKYAPMGSALCFPVLSLVVWSLLTGGTRDADTRSSIYVYGDDVIVPTAYAERAIELLESFGLKVNRDKSCIKGLFRESCGMDAFKGTDVTPVRLRTPWSSSRRPDTYTSWIAYANSFYDRHYRRTYDFIVRRLHHIYGAIPGNDMNLSCPSLRYVDVDQEPKRTRINRSLQKKQYYVWDVKARSIRKHIDGWSMLLRYFTEGHSKSMLYAERQRGSSSPSCGDQPFTVSLYTERGTSMLVKRWR